MKISDLIKSLQMKMAEHGDLDIATSGEHYDTFKDDAHTWVGYKPVGEKWGWELQCDEELEDEWGVSDRNSLVKMLIVS
jgi:hypothetical protein